MEIETVAFVLAPDELVGPIYRQSLKQSKRGIIVAVTLSSIMIFLILSTDSNNSPFLAMFVGMFALALLLPGLIWLQVKRAAGNCVTGQEYQYWFSVGEMRSRTSLGSNSLLKYGDIVGCREFGSGFLLFLSKVYFVVVPKRVFCSESDYQQALEWVKAAVPVMK